MGTEIERKFLVDTQYLPQLAGGEKIVQGYLASLDNVTVRVRRYGEGAYLTIKGKTQGISRAEFEYPIPLDDAELMLSELCPGPKIEKTRYRIPHQGFTWELDVFAGENEGLVMAEVELEDAHQNPPQPRWVGRDVSEDSRFYNSNLLKNPYRSWSRDL